MLPADKAQAVQLQAAWTSTSASREDGIHHCALNIVIFESTEVIENRSDVHTHRNALLFSKENIEIHYILGLDAPKRNLITKSSHCSHKYGFYWPLLITSRVLIVFQKKCTQLLIYANSQAMQSENMTVKMILFNTKLICAVTFFM